MPVLNYIREHLCFVLLCAGGRNYSAVELATRLLCLPAKNDTVNQKIFGRDEKALTTLKLLNCTGHFVIDDILRHPFNACTNFYLFSKCDCSEILKLEIISSSFHQQQEPEPAVQGQLLVPSAATSRRKLLAGAHLHEEEMQSPACTHWEETWQKVLHEGLVRSPEVHSGHWHCRGVCGMDLTMLSN